MKRKGSIIEQSKQVVGQPLPAVKGFAERASRPALESGIGQEAVHNGEEHKVCPHGKSA